jgi:potassium/chloride transporter 4/5/6
VLLGWPEDPERLEVLLRVGRRLERLQKSLLVGRPRALDPQRNGRSRNVHVWWGGLQRNGDLMLLLAHLLTRNRAWRDARIRVLSLASNDLMRAETERQLGRLMPEIRIRGEVDVIVKPPDVSVKDVIHTESADADLVLLGLATPEPDAEAAYARRLCELAEGLESFLFVKNNSVFIGDLVSAEPAAPPAEAAAG